MNKRLFNGGAQVTLRDVARRTRLSLSVVSRALNPRPDKNARVADATRARIADAACALGFRPNRHAAFLRRGQVPTLGVFLPDVPNRLVADLMIGISLAAAAARYPLNFYFGLTAASYGRFFAREGAVVRAGMITYPFFNVGQATRRRIDAYRARGGQVLVLNASGAVAGIPVVRFDEAAGGRLAARHLLERRCGAFHVDEYPERTAGFLAELAAAGVAGQRLATGQLVPAVQADLAAGRRPVGVFCTTDLEALRALRRLRAAGLSVGSDVLVIGYDDLFIVGEADPPLTTIHQPFREEGRLAVEQLVALIHGEVAADAVVQPRLIVRESA